MPLVDQTTNQIKFEQKFDEFENPVSIVITKDGDLTVFSMVLNAYTYKRKFYKESDRTFWDYNGTFDMIKNGIEDIQSQIKMEKMYAQNKTINSKLASDAQNDSWYSSYERMMIERARRSANPPLHISRNERTSLHGAVQAAQRAFTDGAITDAVRYFVPEHFMQVHDTAPTEVRQQPDQIAGWDIESFIIDEVTGWPMRATSTRPDAEGIDF